MALPLLTVAVPTVVPPVVQVVGAVVWAKTLKVMVPEAFEPEEAARVEVMLPAVMAVPIVPFVGPLAVSVGVALATTVSESDIPAVPQPEFAAPLLASPP